MVELVGLKISRDLWDKVVLGDILASESQLITTDMLAVRDI